VPSQRLRSPPLRRVIVAFDGSDGALKACELAVALAKNLGSDVTLVYVIPSLSIFTAPLADQYYALHQGEAEKMIGSVLSLFKKEGVRAGREILQAHDSIVESIVGYAADNHSDLIIMGARGLGGFEKMLVGSVSSGVLAHAHCPVLVVR
jgi:nucleotide-binding universal stress UspA family protein